MSSSGTQTISKRNAAPKVHRGPRFLDYMYDPVYTVSSQLDYSRDHFKACALKNPVRRIPEFETMFSDSPGYTLKVVPMEPMPIHLDLHWRGRTEQCQETLRQLAGVDVIPTDYTWLKRQQCQVTGADYWKYLQRPLIPFGQKFLPDVHSAVSGEDFVTSSTKRDKEQPTHRSVGVQTDYRESETQTDPYSPEYVAGIGTTPAELLELAVLTWGHGLPAGLAEVEMIERARAKRAWEATLPLPNDLSHLNKRRRMMEEMEAKEWAFREGEIQKVQEFRLAVLEDLLRESKVAEKDLANERLNQIYSEYQKEREVQLCKVHFEYIRALRILEAKRKNVERKFVRWDIVTDSQTYLLKEQTRRDVATIRNATELESKYLDNYEGLQEVEAGLKPWMTRPKSMVVNHALRFPVTKAVEQLNKYKAQRDLEKKLMAKPVRFRVVKPKSEPYPVTPDVGKPPEEDEEKELAAIYTQKLIRGRSLQCEMFKGKDSQMALIKEMRTVQALQSEGQGLIKVEKELIMTLKKQREKRNHKTSEKEASKAKVLGAELEQLFDTLSKELIHLQEERRIHAFMLLAERERRRREAEESGKRQLEERRRKEDDEIFRRVVQVHQESVDMYLEDVILGTINKVADETAREEIQRKAKEINDIADAMEKSRNSLQSEEIVSELVYSFLIPEVERINMRERVHQKQERHLHAARSLIKDITTHTGTDSPGPSQ